MNEFVDTNVVNFSHLINANLKKLNVVFVFEIFNFST